MSDLLPLSACSAIAKYSCEDEGFALHVVEGEGERSFRARVEFSAPFAVTPLVHVGLAGFDIDRDDTARLHVHAEAITTSGFDVVLTTWRRTRVYGASVSWLAIG
jgi:hypothetical protein